MLVNQRHILRYLRHPQNIALNVVRRMRNEPTDVPFVFVVGPPRSGTTLLQRILSVHSRICSFEGEVDPFSPKDIHDYERFSHILTEEQFREATRQTTSQVGFCVYLHEHFLQRGMVYLEKTPQNARRVTFLCRYFPGSRIVHIVRDPRDCFASARRGKNIPQAKQVRVYARYWQECVAGRLRAAESEQVCDLRYEDLAADPLPVIETVMSFLGLPFEQSQLCNTNIGSDMRAAQGPFLRLSQPIDTQSVGCWRRELSDEEVSVIESICGPAMERYGYRLARECGDSAAA